VEAPNQTSNKDHYWVPPVWERKYSFGILGILFAFCALYVVHRFQFPEKEAIVSILATDFLILLITTIFLTGQAKIDIQALYGRPASSTNVGVAGALPPNGGKVGL
jgi:hypothetical protein